MVWAGTARRPRVTLTQITALSARWLLNDHARCAGSAAPGGGAEDVAQCVQRVGLCAVVDVHSSTVSGDHAGLAELAQVMTGRRLGETDRGREVAGAYSATGVNGQFDVPAGGQVKVPTLCGMF